MAGQAQILCSQLHKSPSCGPASKDASDHTWPSQVNCTLGDVVSIHVHLEASVCLALTVPQHLDLKQSGHVPEFRHEQELYSQGIPFCLWASQGSTGGRTEGEEGEWVVAQIC